MTPEPTDRSFLKRFAWLSIAAAVTTIALKTLAYQLTGSVGLLSDALESFVNLAGAVVALAMLSVAARPADEDHAYGHTKAEYFASGVEGTLILVAAGAIAWTAVDRLRAPRPIEQAGLGLVISTVQLSGKTRSQNRRMVRYPERSAVYVGNDLGRAAWMKGTH